MKRYWWGLAAWAALHGAAAGADCSAHSARSPAYRVALVELYTSEGCSSCPPADRFLSGLAGGHAVLLSLHVDYWNYIGWKDPFSRAAFTERQRYLADLANTRTIYTPPSSWTARSCATGRAIPWPRSSAPTRVRRRRTSTS